ncbi:MAG: putative C4-dicarboxylase binding protein periplasmic protein [Cyanobacteriota bacterium]|jgi:TRAP-type C4-dicarboxylate transport system substrate-binding protein
MAVAKSPWLWLLAGVVAGGGAAAVIARGGWPWANHDRIGDFRSRLSPERTTTVLGAIGGKRGVAVRRAKFIGYHLTNQGNNDPTTIELRRFWQRVAARTNGQLNMTVLTRDADLAGADNEAILGTALGRFDAVTANGPIFSNVIPKVAPIMTLLFAYDSSREGLALVSDPTFGKVLEESGKPYNLVFLPGATLNSGMRVMTSRAVPTITKAEDLKGFRLRIPPSRDLENQLKALGVKPTLQPVSVLIEVLRSGKSDGQENPPSFIDSFGIYKVNDRLIVTNHLWSGFLTAINSTTWNAWPKAWQDIVRSELKTLQTRQWAAQEQLNTRLIAQAPQRFGMVVLRPNLTNVNRDPSFRAARERVVDRLDERLKPLARRLIDGDFAAR